jgi:hypothetical protein
VRSSEKHDRKGNALDAFEDIVSRATSLEHLMLMGECEAVRTSLGTLVIKGAFKENLIHVLPTIRRHKELETLYFDSNPLYLQFKDIVNVTHCNLLTLTDTRPVAVSRMAPQAPVPARRNKI